MRLLNSVQRCPNQFTELILCSPFLDEEIVPMVVDLAKRTDRAGCGFRILTKPAAANRLYAAFFDNARWSKKIIVHQDLHAKIYLAISRERQSEVIVTSANLTLAGIEGNVELGIRATATSRIGRVLVEQVRQFLFGIISRTHLSTITR
jgi:hypothetical protein